MSLKDLDRYHYDRLRRRIGVLTLPPMPDLGKVAETMREPTLPYPIILQLGTAASMNAYLQAGQRVYELGPALLSLFELTDMGSLKGSMLKLPYPGIYLHLEGCSVIMERAKDDAQLPITGLYIAQAGDYWIISIIAKASPVDSALSFPWPQQEWVDSGLDFDAFVEARLGPGAGDPTADVYRGALRIIAHTLLYLASKEPELEPVVDTSRAGLERDLTRLKGRRLISVRESLTSYTHARVVRVYPSVQALDVERAGAWIRGHWRHYWVGQGRTKCEPRWIQPHYRRGSDDLE